MTGEEMERAIEFLLQSQANFETRLAGFEAQQRRTDERIAETNEQIAETNRIVQLQAETQTQFIGIVTSSMEALAASQRRTDERFKKMDERLSRTDERLDRLAGIVERHIVEGHGDS